SSLLRAAGEQLQAVDANALELPDLPLVDALPGPLAEQLDRLAACGLSEARLLLRRPSELSDGQRYRFRLAYAAGSTQQAAGSKKEVSSLPAAGCPLPAFVLADEFCAVLDRTLAKVLAFNVRK